MGVPTRIANLAAAIVVAVAVFVGTFYVVAGLFWLSGARDGEHLAAPGLFAFCSGVVVAAVATRALVRWRRGRSGITVDLSSGDLGAGGEPRTTTR